MTQRRVIHGKQSCLLSRKERRSLLKRSRAPSSARQREEEEVGVFWRGKRKGRTGHPLRTRGAMEIVSISSAFCQPERSGILPGSRKEQKGAGRLCSVIRRIEMYRPSRPESACSARKRGDLDYALFLLLPVMYENQG